MAVAPSANILAKELKALQKEKWVNIEVDTRLLHRIIRGQTLIWISQLNKGSNGEDENLFDWSVALIVTNPESVYYGGYFKAKMTFPTNYPYSPPSKLCEPRELCF